MTDEAAALYELLGRALVEWSLLCLYLRWALIEQVPGGQPIIGPDVTEWRERDLIERYFEASERWKARRDANGFSVSTEGGPSVWNPTGSLPDDTEVAEVLKAWLHRLHDERNRLVHDAWFVGQAVTGDAEPVFSAERFDVREVLPDALFPTGDSSPEGLLAFTAEVHDATRAASQFRVIRQRGGFAPTFGLVVDGDRVKLTDEVVVPGPPVTPGAPPATP